MEVKKETTTEWTCTKYSFHQYVPLKLSCHDLRTRSGKFCNLEILAIKDPKDDTFNTIHHSLGTTPRYCTKRIICSHVEDRYVGNDAASAGKLPRTYTIPCNITKRYPGTITSSYQKPSWKHTWHSSGGPVPRLLQYNATVPKQVHCQQYKNGMSLKPNTH